MATKSKKAMFLGRSIVHSIVIVFVLNSFEIHNMKWLEYLNGSFEARKNAGENAVSNADQWDRKGQNCHSLSLQPIYFQPRQLSRMEQFVIPFHPKSTDPNQPFSGSNGAHRPFAPQYQISYVN